MEPLQITFRGFPTSEAIESKIKAKAEKLGRLSDRITSCKVVIDAPHHHQHKGNTYLVGITLSVPDAELVVGQHGAHDHAHEDVYVAIRDAFEALERQLHDYVSRRRGEAKRHESSRT